MGLANALSVLTHAVMVWVGAFVRLVVASAVWALCAATVILLPFGTVGLMIVADRATYGERVAWGELRALVIEYAWPGVQWTALSVAGWGGLYLALAYDPTAQHVSPDVQAVLTLGGLIWFAVQIYGWPLLLAQADRRAWAVLRSAALMALSAPFFTLAFAPLAAILVLAIYDTLPYGLLGAGFVAVLAVVAVRDRLDAVGLTPNPDRIAVSRR